MTTDRRESEHREHAETLGGILHDIACALGVGVFDCVAGQSIWYDGSWRPASEVSQPRSIIV